jgi:trehalose synthase
MIKIVSTDHGYSLDNYESIAHLTAAVRELRAEARMLVPQIKDRNLWMISSTANGGGVAEMLPQMISLLGDLGLKTRWAVIGTDNKKFFPLTKRIHNMIHGQGKGALDREEKQLFEAINKENADSFMQYLKPKDIVVIHDPQPLAMGSILKKETGITTLWRCHIGLDRHLPVTHAAWTFLKPYAKTYDHAVFSAPEYIPDYLAGFSTIIHPGLDPCSHKNRELSPHKLVGILCNSGLKVEREPVLTPPFSKPAMRLRGDGSFVPANSLGGIGLLYRTTVTQISRWDRLKGYRPLLEAFLKLKRRLNDRERKWDPRHRRRIGIARLVLGGPDPESIQDDPEGSEVLQELIDYYCNLTPEYQKDIALLTLPMESRKENALMVNTLQRCSTIVVQNSIQEGFGLTATEAMWKRVPILGTHACGLRQQIRYGIDGMLTYDPNNPDEIADNIDQLLKSPIQRDLMAISAQRRVQDEFLIFSQLRYWLRLLASCVDSSHKNN